MDRWYIELKRKYRETQGHMLVAKQPLFYTNFKEPRQKIFCKILARAIVDTLSILVSRFCLNNFFKKIFLFRKITILVLKIFNFFFFRITYIFKVWLRN